MFVVSTFGGSIEAAVTTVNSSGFAQYVFQFFPRGVNTLVVFRVEDEKERARLREWLCLSPEK